MKRNLIFKGFVFATFLVTLSGCTSSAGENVRNISNNSTTSNNSTANVSVRNSGNRSVNMQNSPEKTETKNEINTNIDELAKNVNLPVRPSEAVWKKKTMDNESGAVPGPNDYYLTAVLKYTDADIEKLKDATGQNKDEVSKGIIELEQWFPEEIKKLAKDIDGEKLLPGEKYDAEKFMRSPFRNGTLSRIEDSNYFVLNLYST